MKRGVVRLPNLGGIRTAVNTCAEYGNYGNWWRKFVNSFQIRDFGRKRRPVRQLRPQINSTNADGSGSGVRVMA
jgi:hypothetical protein